MIRLKSFARYRVIGRELFSCQASEVDLLQALGPPTSEVDPPLGSGEPRMFWDVEFPCGLVMGLQFDRLRQHLLGHLDGPDVAHALRHLRLRPADLWTLEEAEPSAFATVAAGAPPMPRTFTLYEAEADSPPETVASGVTERDARCQLAELDGLEPGVRMWVTDGSGEATTPPPAPVLDLQRPRMGTVTPDAPRSATRRSLESFTTAAEQQAPRYFDDIVDA